MNATLDLPRSKSFWVVGILALLWNLLGVVMFFLQLTMSAEQLAALPADEQAIYNAVPQWLYVVFAIAVFGGVLGAIGLLAKKRWAVTMFFVSLLAVLAQYVGLFTSTPAWDLKGLGTLVMPGIVFLIALYLWWYSQKAAVRGWLN
ncbi:MAG TPA: hypothetical protein VM469_09055 [Pseudoxanthomonas sp.]|jgi:hypothetical protein|nr:hypothetical protein [Pseudoxanthomonas sp.]